MRRLLNEGTHYINRMDLTEVFFLAIVLVVVGMFFLRGSVFRSK